MLTESFCIWPLDIPLYCEKTTRFALRCLSIFWSCNSGWPRCLSHFLCYLCQWLRQVQLSAPEAGSPQGQSLTQQSHGHDKCVLSNEKWRGCLAVYSRMCLLSRQGWSDCSVICQQAHAQPSSDKPKYIGILTFDLSNTQRRHPWIARADIPKEAFQSHVQQHGQHMQAFLYSVLGQGFIYFFYHLDSFPLKVLLQECSCRHLSRKVNNFQKCTLLFISTQT